MIINRNFLNNEGVEMNAETPDDFFPRAKMVTRNQFADDGCQIAGIEGFFAKAPTRIVERVMAVYQIDEQKQIFVKSNFNPTGDGNKVAFSERHPAQPNGEAFIAGAKPVLVALTAAATDALNNGLILPCDDAEVSEFTNEKYKNARRQLNIQKEIHRRKFAALIGNDFGFEKAWAESIRGREALNIVETVL
jgi:hypothetical protein